MADSGAAIFYDPRPLQYLVMSTIKPLDGPGTSRFDEKSCMIRLQNTENNEQFKSKSPQAYQHEVATFTTALLAIQAWKKDRGIALDTSDVIELRKPKASGTTNVVKK